MPRPMLVALCCLALTPGLCAEESWFTEPAAPGPFIGLKAADLTAVRSFGADQPVVGTYLFYWYDVVSGAHVKYADGGDACQDHPPSWDDYSYNSTAWWRRQLADITAAGVDFAAPVYWGCPNGYEAWSFQGLPHLVEACDQMDQAGQAHPQVALFYDTTTLAHNRAGRQVDLSTPDGKAWFFCTVRDFFSYIPPRHWAAREGRPLILLYSPGFAARQDPALFPYVRERFQKDFGVNPYLIKQTGWQGEADSTCNWGAAVSGLSLAGCAAVGPGYDHTAVRGRRPLIVPRQDGQFYAGNWERLLHYKPVRRPKLVMVETWNEFHEGTDVAESREYGRQYIELTRKYADLFHAGAQVELTTGPYARATELKADLGKGRADGGVRVSNAGDGLTVETEVGGKRCLQSAPNDTHGRYIYFALDDGFVFDLDPQQITIEVEVYDGGAEGFILQYDSLDPRASIHEGAFKDGRRVALGGTNTWRRETFTLQDARFSNRTNGSDFRLAVIGTGELAVAGITIAKGR